MPLEMVSRLEWSGVELRELKGQTLVRPASDVFFMSSNTPPCPNQLFCAAALRYHLSNYMRTYCNDIRYNFMIGGDGNIYEGRGWNSVPFLPKDFALNSPFSILIAFIGEYNEDTVPDLMLQAANRLIQIGVDGGFITPRYVVHNIMVKKMTFNKISETYERS